MPQRFNLTPSPTSPSSQSPPSPRKRTRPHSTHSNSSPVLFAHLLDQQQSNYVGQDRQKLTTSPCFPDRPLCPVSRSRKFGEPDFSRLLMLRIARFWFTSTVSISIFTSRLVSRAATPQLSPCLRASPRTSGGSSARRTIHDHAKRNISRFLRDPRFEPCLHPSGTIPVKQLRDGTFRGRGFQTAHSLICSICGDALPCHQCPASPPLSAFARPP